MRITIVQGAFLPVPPLMGGAVEKVWFALAKEFALRGHQVTHISRSYAGLAAAENIEGVNHIRVRGSDTPVSLLHLKWLDLLYSLRVRRCLPEADILVTNTFWLPMLLRNEKRGLLYIHVARYPKGQMRFYAHAARLQTVSSDVADAIRREVPHLESRIQVIPYPLSPALRDEPAPRTNGAREKQILFVGRLHPEKGVHLLLTAVASMPREQLNGWRVLIVGPAETSLGGGGQDYLATLKKLAEPIEEMVDWPGPVFETDRLAEIYRKAALFVYPSLADRGETFGLAPLEAMAQGCPPLVSDLRCFKDFIEDGRTGFVFDHHSSNPEQALAQKIREIILHPELLTATAEQCRHKALEYALPGITNAYLRDFEAVLAARKA